MAKRIDLTKGPILKGIFLFALPLVLGNILQQLYTTVDTVIIGNYCGSSSLAAVGTSAQPIEVLLCLFLGIGAGVSILVSQCVGAKDEKRIRKTLKTSVFFVYCASIPLTLIGILLIPSILSWMAVPEEVKGEATLYTSLVLLGTLGNIGYNMNAGILRGLGDSKASLYFLLASTVTNIVLDLLFVAVFRWNVGGVALATTLSMFLSWFFSIFYLKRRFPELEFPVFSLGYEKEELKRIVKLGLPLGFNSALFALGHIALQVFVNLQGAVYMAGCSVALRVTGIANVAITALASATIAFSGQNFGAGNYGRLKQGHLLIPFAAALSDFVCALPVILFLAPILRFFTQDEAVLFYASRYVVVMLLSYWIYTVFECVSKVLNGVGLIRYTTFVNLMVLWVVRVPSAYFITRFFDGTWVMLAYPISFTVGMVLMLGYYGFSPRWRELMERKSRRSLERDF